MSAEEGAAIGGNVDVRMLPGGAQAAQSAFDFLSVGGRPLVFRLIRAVSSSYLEALGGLGFAQMHRTCQRST